MHIVLHLSDERPEHGPRSNGSGIDLLRPIMTLALNEGQNRQAVRRRAGRSRTTRSRRGERRGGEAERYAQQDERRLSKRPSLRQRSALGVFCHSRSADKGTRKPSSARASASVIGLGRARPGNQDSDTGYWADSTSERPRELGPACWNTSRREPLYFRNRLTSKPIHPMAVVLHSSFDNSLAPTGRRFPPYLRDRNRSL
jgi:hypothetical protein